MGTEIEYAPLGENLPNSSPIFWSGAVVAAYLGVTLPTGDPAFDGAWVASLSEQSRLTPAVRVAGVVAAADAGLPSAFLANGARIYVDHAHPEYSTPETDNPLEATYYNMAGDLAIADGARLASEELSQVHPDGRIRVFKSNSDGKGHSWGAHENYLLPRSLPFDHLVSASAGFFVVRNLFCGAGKVGSENGRPQVPFQITQRADFFTQLTSSQTTHQRGIINTRDEPHADPEKFRRFHVICGDANVSPYALWLKLGTTALVLRAIASGRMNPISDWVTFADPVSANVGVSHDLELTATYPTAAGQQVSALDLLEVYFEMVSDDLADRGGPDWAPGVMSAWEEMLGDLLYDPASVADRVDWAAKYRMLTEGGVDLSSARAKAFDLLYHELVDGAGYRMLSAGMFRLPPGFDLSRVDAALTTPPATRAALRAAAILEDSEIWEWMDWGEGRLLGGHPVVFPVD